MKTKKPILFFYSIVFLSLLIPVSCNSSGTTAKGGDPWTAEQLMEPAELNKILLDTKAEKPVIFSIGFGGGIPGSLEMGAARDEVNIQKLKTELSKLSKNKSVVIYCGCCPFENCPNVRPAFKVMGEMGFTNYKLLNLRENFKVDWMDKGFPVSK